MNSENCPSQQVIRHVFRGAVYATEVLCFLTYLLVYTFNLIQFLAEVL